MATPAQSVLAVARLYHSPLNSTSEDDWTYSQLKGIACFGTTVPLSNPDAKPEYWFRLFDQSDNRLLWIFKAPADMAYREDKPFFQTFEGRSRRFGLLFESDADATKFAHVVKTSLGSIPPTRQRSNSGASSLRSLISTPDPSSFVHKSHVGVNRGKVEVSTDMDPIWRQILFDMKRGRESYHEQMSSRASSSELSRSHSARSGPGSSLSVKSSPAWGAKGT
ncbi:hypothetical protein DL96DRAFT_1550727 [Flagelloscypha sp. PMI_526]|nr:hypothetical protein DL96DRAFT_1550727 [Flagelloscypha sp. PMI_526]